MKRKAAIIAALVMLFSACFGTAAEAAAKNAAETAFRVYWASADYAVIQEDEDSPMSMVRLKDGKTLYSDINYQDSTGGYLCICTDEGAFLIDRTGGTVRLDERFAGGENYTEAVRGKFGLFYSVSYEQSCIYDPAADTYTVLPEQRIFEMYRDAKGRVYVLTEDCGIYRSDGKQILKPGKYTKALNCNYTAVTNEYLTVWDREGSAAVLSPYTGKVLHTFTGMGWEAYDENHQIYRDNTAVIGPPDEDGYYNGAGTTVVGLDGTVLKELPEGTVFSVRYEGDDGYPIESGDGGSYNPLTDRTYYFEGYADDPGFSVVCEETGERFRAVRDKNGNLTKYKSETTGKTYSAQGWPGEYEVIPERYEKYRPVQDRFFWLRYIEADWEESDNPYMAPYRIEILSPKGKVLGDRYWKDLNAEWTGTRELIEGFRLFENAPVLSVMDENDLYAVISSKGKIVLPSEYEQIYLIGTFSDDPKENGHALAAFRDGQWHFFTLAGKPLAGSGKAAASEQP